MLYEFSLSQHSVAKVNRNYGIQSRFTNIRTPRNVVIVGCDAAREKE